MLLTKEIKVYSKIIKIEKLSINSHKKVKVKCDNCGNIKHIKYQSYNISTNNNKDKYYCNNKECINKKREISVKNKYGVTNISKLNNTKEKKIDTCIKNYGVEHPTQSKEVKNKIKEKNKEKYGVDWITQSKYFKEESIKTNLEKYGVEHPTQSEHIKNKIKETCLVRYGYDSYMKTENFKEKYNYFCMNFYGVDHLSKSKVIQEKIQKTNLKKYNKKRPTESKIIKDKIKNTFIEKYGVDNPMKLSYFKNKIKKTNLEKYNSKYYSQSSIFKDKIKKRKIRKLEKKYNLKILDIKNNIILSECNECGDIFEANYQLLYNRFLYGVKLCTKCNIVCSFSNKENEIKNFIQNYNNNIVIGNRTYINPYELDIYLPNLNLAFEFNGLYWHSELYKDKDYHLNKTEQCEKNGIQLIHIYEDDWIYKQDIVKSMILNKMGKISNKIYARKTEIKEVNDNKLIRNFLEKNHIQGFVGSKVKLGLFYYGKLVSLMTFGKRRLAMGKKKSNDNEYELLRFCNKLNTNVVGGASKLFKYFIRNYNPKEIMTYADRSYSSGNLYKILGFEYNGKTQPNYYYIINGIKNHRFNFRKDKLIKEGFNSNKTEHEIMLERKIYRIYDSGSLKYLFK